MLYAGYGVHFDNDVTYLRHNENEHDDTTPPESFPFFRNKVKMLNDVPRDDSDQRPQYKKHDYYTEELSSHSTGVYLLKHEEIQKSLHSHMFIHSTRAQKYSCS